MLGDAMTQATINGLNGEYRRLSATEVGLLIRIFRKEAGIKRAVLASDANVSEKTLERAESGEGISEDSARRIAEALGVAPDAFTSELFVPADVTEVQRLAKRQEEQQRATHQPVAVTELKGVRDVLPLFRADALTSGEQAVGEAHLAAFAEVQQACQDWGDGASDLPHPELVKAAQSFLEEVHKFEALGYVVMGGVAQRYLKHATPETGQSSSVPFSVAVLTAFPKPRGIATPPKQVWLPKRMQLGW